MKLTLITFVALLFSAKAYCQTLTFEEIIHLHDRQDIKQYLKSKSFLLLSAEENSFDYIINGRTDNEETINIFRNKAIGYSTRNISYAEELLKQIKNKYHKISGFDEPKYKLYQFGDPNMVITVNIEKGKSSNSIAIEWK
jgi:hypothetical protein